MIQKTINDLQNGRIGAIEVSSLPEPLLQSILPGALSIPLYQNNTTTPLVFNILDTFWKNNITAVVIFIAPCGIGLLRPLIDTIEQWHLKHHYLQIVSCRFVVVAKEQSQLTQCKARVDKVNKIFTLNCGNRLVVTQVEALLIDYKE